MLSARLVIQAMDSDLLDLVKAMRNSKDADLPAASKQARDPFHSFGKSKRAADFTYSFGGTAGSSVRRARLFIVARCHFPVASLLNTGDLH